MARSNRVREFRPLPSADDLLDHLPAELAELLESTRMVEGQLVVFQPEQFQQGHMHIADMGDAFHGHGMAGVAIRNARIASRRMAAAITARGSCRITVSLGWTLELGNRHADFACPIRVIRLSPKADSASCHATRRENVKR